jgi:hypothetical protein
MILANLLALAAASGLPARVAMGFDDAAVERLLGIDGRHEFPLCLLTIGGGSTAPLAAEVPDLALATRPLSAEEIEYPQTVGAQDSGRLQAREVAAWRGSGGTFERPGSGTAPGPDDLLENVIRRRGSARSFDREPIPEAALATILDRATRGVPSDYAPAGSRLAEPFLIANRVRAWSPAPTGSTGSSTCWPPATSPSRRPISASSSDSATTPRRRTSSWLTWRRCSAASATAATG